MESQRDVDEFLELVGRDAPVYLKIESRQGMEYVAREFKKRDNLRLCAAKGDMYVELDRPYHILEAQKLIIEKDPQALAGSRMLLSAIKRTPHLEKVVDPTVRYLKKITDPESGIFYGMRMVFSESEVPSDADFEQLAWLYDIGYRSFMLCDELCLYDGMLSVATNALAAFKKYYTR